MMTHEKPELELLRGIASENQALVSSLLTKHPQLAHSKISLRDGNEITTALMHTAAFTADNTNMLKLILSYSPDLDACDYMETTALMGAAMVGNRRICQVLTQANLIHAVDHDGNTALMHTIMSSITRLDQKFFIFTELLDRTPDEQLLHVNTSGESLYILVLSIANYYKKDSTDAEFVVQHFCKPVEQRLAQIRKENPIISYDLKGRLSSEETARFKTWLSDFIMSSDPEAEGLSYLQCPFTQCLIEKPIIFAALQQPLHRTFFAFEENAWDQYRATAIEKTKQALQLEAERYFALTPAERGRHSIKEMLGTEEFVLSKTVHLPHPILQHLTLEICEVSTRFQCTVEKVDSGYRKSQRGLSYSIHRTFEVTMNEDTLESIYYDIFECYQEYLDTKQASIDRSAIAVPTEEISVTAQIEQAMQSVMSLPFFKNTPIPSTIHPYPTTITSYHN